MPKPETFVRPCKQSSIHPLPPHQRPPSQRWERGKQLHRFPPFPPFLLDTDRQSLNGVKDPRIWDASLAIALEVLATIGKVLWDPLNRFALSEACDKGNGSEKNC